MQKKKLQSYFIALEFAQPIKDGKIKIAITRLGLQEQKFKRWGCLEKKEKVFPANMHCFYWQGFTVIHLIFRMAPELNAVEIKCHHI